MDPIFGMRREVMAKAMDLIEWHPAALARYMSKEGLK
jgi:hypothetical protein